jgi:hypothetical protein
MGSFCLVAVHEVPCLRSNKRVIPMSPNTQGVILAREDVNLGETPIYSATFNARHPEPR